MISLFVEYRQLIGCQNSVIMGRAAAPPGQPGQTGARGIDGPDLVEQDLGLSSRYDDFRPGHGRLSAR
jgi:hypothetical protein